MTISKVLTAVAIGMFADPVFAQESGGIAIIRNGTQDSVVASPDRVAGQHVVDPLFSATEGNTLNASRTVFLPNSRTAWHSHPGGQTLIVTDGVGWVQEWGRDKIKVAAGDVVRFNPGVKHWHGATDTTSMTNIEIQNAVDGANSEWMEGVTDEQFLQ